MWHGEHLKLQRDRDDEHNLKANRCSVCHSIQRWRHAVTDSDGNMRSIFTPPQQFSLPKISDDNCTFTGFRPVVCYGRDILLWQLKKILTITMVLFCCCCCHGKSFVTKEWRQVFVTLSGSQLVGHRSDKVKKSKKKKKTLNQVLK